MELQELHFTFTAPDGFEKFPKAWSHTGVVGSGDMEVLFSQKELSGKAEVKVMTPVKGFDDIWEKVLSRFVEESRLGDVIIEINDNNSSPYIVLTRLRQALIEAKGAEV